MKRALITALALAAPHSAYAQSAQGDVSVTIYNNNQALVQDVRQIALPLGRIKQEFPDVSAQIRAQTVTIGGEAIGIVEQNFDYDLLSPDKLMQKAVGQVVTIVRTNPATGLETREQAKVLAANGGIVLQIGQRIEVLRDDGLPVRVVFDKVPANLRARPTLSVTLQSAKAGTRPISLSYLTPSLGWTADYVALFDEKKSTIDVQGWITLTNNTGTSFDNARTYLVAGSPSSGGFRNYGSYDDYAPSGGVMTKAGTETAKRERLGDFYIYPLAERTTIAQAQQKQVSFLDAVNVPARKAYEYRLDWKRTIENPVSVSTGLKFSTSGQGGLGDALPAGIMRFYIRDARGQPQFIGENSIGHTPMGSELSIKTGDAFDVRFKSILERDEEVDNGEWQKLLRYRVVSPRADEPREYIVEGKVYYRRTTMRYTFTNAKPKPVTVDFIQADINRGRWPETRVPEETIKGSQLNDNERQWQVPVPANGSTDLVVTFITRY